MEAVDELQAVADILAGEAWWAPNCPEAWANRDDPGVLLGWHLRRDGHLWAEFSDGELRCVSTTPIQMDAGMDNTRGSWHKSKGWKFPPVADAQRTSV